MLKRVTPRALFLVLAAAALAGCYPPVSVDAPYASAVYEADEISFIEGVQFGTGIDDQGERVALKLDIFGPPSNGNARPTLVLMHGGGYIWGARTDFHAEARQWARNGYVVVTPSYRLASTVPPERFLDVGPALQASSDGQLAIKWLRANASGYDIDPDRLAVLGSSAGGVIALMTGQELDLTGDRHDGDESHVPTAVYSTGGPARPLIDQGWITTAGVGAPALVHHFENDVITEYEGGEAGYLCLVWSSSPSTDRCTPVVSPGEGHTVGLGPTDDISFGQIMPFLASELDLATAAAP